MTPEEIVDVVTPKEAEATVQAHLDQLGMTLEELKHQAETDSFESGKAWIVWTSIKPFVTSA